jgi:hypothetical protein
MPKRGYEALYRLSVTQAPFGCDFDFLMPAAAEPDDRAGE